MLITESREEDKTQASGGGLPRKGNAFPSPPSSKKTLPLSITAKVRPIHLPNDPYRLKAPPKLITLLNSTYMHLKTTRDTRENTTTSAFPKFML